MPYNFSYVIPGKLAGMAKPGSVDDLATDLKQLLADGIGAVVSFTERPLDEALVREHGMDYLHLPVPDFTPPTNRQIEKFVRYVKEHNDRGVAVAGHCAAGMGRTGTMLACYLVSLGVDPVEAIDSVRSIRPGSIETVQQEQCVVDFGKKLSNNA